MDPHCGWCYGNSENITSIFTELQNDFEFEFLVGGMWLGENAPKGGESLHKFIEANAPRMCEYTGVEVSDKFYNLTKDISYSFSSLEPCAAIVVIKKIAPTFTFQAAKEIQKAIFIDGKKLDELETYIPILETFSIKISDFENEWLSEENITETLKEFETAKSFANGFPTMILKDEKDAYYLLANGYFHKDEMFEKLKQLK